MTDRKPAPPRPLVRTPDEPPEPPAPALAPVHSATGVGPIILTIRAEVTIPATHGYARRLGNLIADLRRSIEAQAPWLTHVTVDVDRGTP